MHMTFTFTLQLPEMNREIARRTFCIRLSEKEIWLPARFEPATLRLTAEDVKSLHAASDVAYKKFGAILPRLVAPRFCAQEMFHSPTRTNRRPFFGNRRSYLRRSPFGKCASAVFQNKTPKSNDREYPTILEAL
jgi:hypothetical protein